MDGRWSPESKVCGFVRSNEFHWGTAGESWPLRAPQSVFTVPYVLTSTLSCAVAEPCGWPPTGRGPVVVALEAFTVSGMPCPARPRYGGHESGRRQRCL